MNHDLKRVSAASLARPLLYPPPKTGEDHEDGSSWLDSALGSAQSHMRDEPSSRPRPRRGRVEGSSLNDKPLIAESRSLHFAARSLPRAKSRGAASLGTTAFGLGRALGSDHCISVSAS